jgi:cytochrome P450
MFDMLMLPFSEYFEKLPLPAIKRFEKGRDTLDRIIYRMIAERRASGEDKGDLLSMLLMSQDDEATAGDDTTMSDKQVRDEALTLFLAGHETTANALSFALWLLARQPGLQEELAAECVRVLQGRPPGAADYSQLALAERIFAEALRLYPPVWVTARTAAESYEYRGMRVERGTILLAPQFAVHRDPRFWAAPLVFDPSRFSAEARAARPKMAFFPFGAGNRQCIGEGLAWMEGTLVLAAIVQEWRLYDAGAAAELPLDPSVTLRPKGPVKLRVERRK